MKVWRLVLASAAILVVLYGVVKIFLSVPPAYLVLGGVWLVAPVLIHHGLVSPLVIAVSWAAATSGPGPRPPLPPGRVDPGGAGDGDRDLRDRPAAAASRRARPCCCRTSAPTSGLLLGIIAGATLIAYAVRVARDRTGSRSTGELGH